MDRTIVPGQRVTAQPAAALPAQAATRAFHFIHVRSLAQGMPYPAFHPTSYPWILTQEYWTETVAKVGNVTDFHLFSDPNTYYLLLEEPGLWEVEADISLYQTVYAGSWGAPFPQATLRMEIFPFYEGEFYPEDNVRFATELMPIQLGPDGSETVQLSMACSTWIYVADDAPVQIYCNRVIEVRDHNTVEVGLDSYPTTGSGEANANLYATYLGPADPPFEVVV